MTSVIDRFDDAAPTTRRLVAAPLSRLAFWSAIAFPLAYLPFVVTGIDTVDELLVFFALLALHLGALLLGRSHRRE